MSKCAVYWCVNEADPRRRDDEDRVFCAEHHPIARDRVIYVVSHLHGGLLADTFAFDNQAAAEEHLERMVVQAAPSAVEDTGVEIPAGAERTTHTYSGVRGKSRQVTVGEYAADADDELYLEEVALATQPDDALTGSTRIRRIAW